MGAYSDAPVMNTPSSPSSLGRTAILVGSIAALTSAEAATPIAQWGFDDVANDFFSTSSVGGYVGNFTGVADFSTAGGGVTGSASDYSLDLRAGGFATNGAMVANSSDLLTALNAATGSQAISLTYWQFLNSTPNSTAFWATSPTSSSGGRGLNAHSPWSNGDAYFDSTGCCDAGIQRTTGPLGASLGTWQLLAYTFEGTGNNDGTRSIYRRDVSGTSTLIAQTVGNGLNLATDIDNFIVGNDNSLANSGMDARIDNFTIWSGALTQGEIDTLAVPEPNSAALLGLAAAALGWRRKRSHSVAV